MAKVDSEKIKHLLTRGVEEVIEKSHLEAALRSGKKLRVKLGIDPTGDKIHIGRAIALWKIKEFQDLGHQVILIIGDYTAQIGDPSDKLAKRPFLTKEQIKKNLKHYLPQIGKVLDLKKTEVRYNSEWLSKLNFREVSELAENFTIQQMVERRNFSERIKKNQDISLRETFYPLMQGYDSVAVKADVELGGTDQLFNLLAGRKIQERYGQKAQDIIMNEMLLGTDGRKMSTSWGNVINVVDSADEQYGKLMSLHDEMIPNYLMLATDLPLHEVVEQKTKLLKSGKVNPKGIKQELAHAVVRRYHGVKAADKAREKFESLFSKKDFSGELPALAIGRKSMTAAELVMQSGVAKSKSDAWRLITQGSVSVNDKKETDPKKKLAFRGGETVKIGKRHFFRVRIEN